MYYLDVLTVSSVILSILWHYFKQGIKATAAHHRKQNKLKKYLTILPQIWLQHFKGGNLPLEIKPRSVTTINSNRPPVLKSLIKRSDHQNIPYTENNVS